MEITYNTPIEVNKRQYQACMSNLSGIVAGRISDGKYYIKVFLMRYKKNVKQILNLYKDQD
jgi:hypothetical protein